MPLSSVGKVEHKAGRLGKTHIKRMFVCHCADATSLNVSVIRLTQSDPHYHLPPSRSNSNGSNTGTLSLPCCGVLRQRHSLMDSFILRGKKRKKPSAWLISPSLFGGFYIEIPSNNDRISLPPRWHFKWKMWLFLSKWGHIKASIILVKAFATDVAIKSIPLLLVTA